MEEAEREEEEEEGERRRKSLQRSWSQRRKRSPWLLVLEDWGGFCATGFGKKMEFYCEEKPMQREVK